MHAYIFIHTSYILFLMMTHSIVFGGLFGTCFFFLANLSTLVQMSHLSLYAPPSDDFCLLYCFVFDQFV